MLPDTSHTTAQGDDARVASMERAYRQHRVGQKESWKNWATQIDGAHEARLPKQEQQATEPEMQSQTWLSDVHH